MLSIYMNTLCKQIPDYSGKYFFSESLTRLKKVGYFCGMDYASKDIYQFDEYISRFTHSLTTALRIDNLTSDKTKTIAGLFHDIATPCFSHVIDYMNKDYAKQESTEEYTERIIKSDEYLQKCLKKDNIKIDDIINFKQYSIVDTDRPKLCADRLDGIMLTGLFWTKNIQKDEIELINKDITTYINEDNEEEIGFKDLDIASRIVDINEEIDRYCHSNEDNYMMELLAKITSIALHKNYIKYDDLYFLDEPTLFKILDQAKDKEIDTLLYEFRTKQLKDIPETILPEVKVRIINPLVNGKRLY